MQLGFAVAGAALGYSMFGAATFLGMSAASWGWSAGSLLGGILGNKNVDLPPQFGPRLSDLKVQTSTYGNAIPRAFGTVRIAGNIIWAPPITEVATTTTVESGGKGGGGQSSSQDQTTYSYYADFAVAICEGPIVGIRKVWANGELINDVGDDSPILSKVGGLATILSAALAAHNAANDAISMTVYTGTETQDPDPTIAAMHGNLTPAFRGTAYVVFQDLPLARFGNRIPNLEFEVVVNGESTIMVPQLFYTLPGGLSYHGTGESGGEIGGRRNSPNAQFYWAVMDTGSPVESRSIGLFNNYTSGLVFSREFDHALGLSSEKGYNDRIWFHENISAKLRAISPSGQVWEFGTFGATDLPRVVQVYEFADPTILDETQDTAPEIFLHYNTPFPFTHTIYHGNASALGSMVVVDTDRGFNQFLDSADQIEGRVYIIAAQNFLDSLLGYCEVGDITSTFHVIRTYDQGSLPYGLAGRDGYLYVRSGLNGFANIIDKMDPDGNIVEQLTLPGIDGGNNSPIRMVQDSFGMLYVQVAQELFRISYGTMEIDAHTTLSDPDYWIMPTDAFEGRGILLTRGDTGNRDDVYILADSIASEAPPLSDVVTELCELSGLTSSDLDVSQLTSDSVSGYVIANRGTVRSMLEPLMGTYFFDAVESDNKIKFVKRGGGVAVTIPEDDLAAHTGAPAEMPDPLRVMRKQEMELPVEVNVSYLNRAIDYQVSSQPSRRLITQSKQSVTLQVPIVFTDTQAKRIADMHIFSAWVERENHEFETGREYAKYEPCDVLGVVKGGVTHNVRVTQKDEGGDGVIKWKAVADFASVYTQVSTGVAPQAEPQEVNVSGPTTIEFLDVPLLRDEDDTPGFYFAAGGIADGWRGVELHRSTDQGVTYGSIARLLPESTIGYAEDVLGAYDPDLRELVDEGNSVTVVVKTGTTLASISREEFLDGGNPAVLGDELIQFRDAELIDTDTYTLTGLLRGRRGSEPYMSTHLAGERFVLLDNNLRTVDQPISQQDQAFYYKPVSIGRSLNSTNPMAFTNTGRRLRPLSPVQLGAGPNGAGDWLMEWERRTRYDVPWLDAEGTVPLGEASEEYIVRIMNGDVVIREIEATTTSATYTAAQQLTDWGGTLTALEFSVAQVSETYGEGEITTYFVNNPDPFASSVILLMHMDGADGGTVFTDEVGHTVTVLGSATTETEQKKFGASSLLCVHGGTNGLSFADIADWEFGTEDFTIEFWVRWRNTVSTASMLICTANTPTEFTPILIYRNNGLVELYASADGTTWGIANGRAFGTLTANTWAHVALTRQGSNWKTFLQGVVGQSWSNASALATNGEGLFIGLGADCYFDEVRITRGVARYTAAFTPPVSPFDI